MITVETRFAINDLVTSYSYGYDEMEWDLYSSVWSDDALLETSLGDTKTKQVIVSAARQMRENLNAQGSRHDTIRQTLC